MKRFLILLMEIKGKCWKVRDKRRLLVALMKEFAGDAHISFEGDLSLLHLFRMPGASRGPLRTGFADLARVHMKPT